MSKDPFLEQANKLKKQILEENKDRLDGRLKRCFSNTAPDDTLENAVKSNVSKVQQELMSGSKDWRADHVAGIFEAQKPKRSKKPVIRRKSIWISFGSAVAAAMILITGLYFVLPLLFPPNEPVRNYSNATRVEAASDIIELNVYLKEHDLSIVFEELYELKVFRVYAEEYNQTLFFILHFESADWIKSGEMTLYVYPLFRPGAIGIYAYTQSTAGEFDVRFHREYEYLVIDDYLTIYTIFYRALIEFNYVIIYIEYTQLSPVNDSNFFDFVKNTLRII